MAEFAIERLSQAIAVKHNEILYIHPDVINTHLRFMVASYLSGATDRLSLYEFSARYFQNLAAEYKGNCSTSSSKDTDDAFEFVDRPNLQKLLLKYNSKYYDDDLLTAQQSRQDVRIKYFNHADDAFDLVDRSNLLTTLFKYNIKSTDNDALTTCKWSQDKLPENAAGPNHVGNFISSFKMGAFKLSLHLVHNIINII